MPCHRTLWCVHTSKEAPYLLGLVGLVHAVEEAAVPVRLHPRLHRVEGELHISSISRARTPPPPPDATLTERIVDITLLLLAAISVLYLLRNLLGGGAAAPNGAANVSACACAFWPDGRRVMAWDSRPAKGRQWPSLGGTRVFLQRSREGARGRGASMSSSKRDTSSSRGRGGGGGAAVRMRPCSLARWCWVGSGRVERWSGGL